MFIVRFAAVSAASKIFFKKRLVNTLLHDVLFLYVISVCLDDGTLHIVFHANNISNSLCKCCYTDQHFSKMFPLILRSSRCTSLKQVKL